MGATTQATAASVPIDQVLKLLTGPNSKALHERHLAALERLCKANAAGFLMQDLPQAQQLLDITLGLVQKGQQNFIEPAVNLIKTLSKPFVKQTSTDESRLLGHVSVVLVSISNVLVQPLPAVIQLAASEMLLVYASGCGTRPSVLTRLPALEELSIGSTARQYLLNNKVLNGSGAIQTIVTGMATACHANNGELMMALGLTLHQISYHPSNTKQLLGAGTLPCLAFTLSLGYTHPLVPVMLELLWNLLEHDAQATRTAMVNKQPTLQQITNGDCSWEVTEGNQPNEQIYDQDETGTSTVQENGVEQGLMTAFQHMPQVDEQSCVSCEQPVDMPSSESRGTSAPSPPPLNGTPSLRFSKSTKGLPDILENDPQDPMSAREDTQAGGDSVAVNQLPCSETASNNRPAVQTGIVQEFAQVLTELFKTALLQGYREVDKELRNDVLVVINLIMGTDHIRLPPPGSHTKTSCGALFAKAAAQHGLFEALLVVSTCPELETLQEQEYAHIVKPWALSTGESDLTLKILAWRAVVAACMHTGQRGSVLPEAKRYNLMRMLLACVETAVAVAPPNVANVAASVCSRWSISVRPQLQQEALARLHSLAALCPESYILEGGQHVMLGLLSTRATTVGAGEQVEATLRHLHHLVKHVPEMAEVLGEGSGLQPLLQLLQEPISSRTTCHWCLLLLASICRINIENLRRLRHENGVAALLRVLQACKTADPTLPSTYIVAALDTVWACIVPDRKNTAKFLVDDGMDVLLDLLETSNPGHRGIILSVLSDLLENSRSHTYFQAWKSSKDARNGAQLLLNVWRDEEAARGMTQNNILCNTTRPLAGTAQRTARLQTEGIVYATLGASLDRIPNALSSHDEVQSSQQGPAVHNGAAVVDAMLTASSGERIFAKVYGCFRQLGFGNFKYLGPSDAATMALVEMYVKFKQGEVWVAIQDQLQEEGLRPTTPDQERLLSGIELTEHLGFTLRDTQRSLMNQEQAAAAAKEAAFFEAMRAQQWLEQEARFYQKDKSQLTIAELREAKQKKENMVKTSIQHVQEHDCL